MRYARRTKTPGRRRRNPSLSTANVLQWLKSPEGERSLAGTSGLPSDHEGREALAKAIARAVGRVAEELAEGGSWADAMEGDQAGYLSEAMYEVGMTTEGDTGGWVSDAMIDAAQRVLKTLVPRANPGLRAKRRR